MSELSKVTYIDSLTGSANKKWFKIATSKLLKQDNLFAFIVLDIDKLKVLNDTFRVYNQDG